MNKQELLDIGIDMNLGLKNFKNNPLMYNRFLEQFITSDQHLSEANEFLKNGDETAFAEKIQGFKKSCDQFGLKECSALCDNVINEGMNADAFDELNTKYLAIAEKFKR
ncbi:MAG: hypothetical protein K5656_12065 [Lachnospiraceae bacterium]|nr:hypothetical protein [Lachnospiraceae bacterium]